MVKYTMLKFNLRLASSERNSTLYPSNNDWKYTLPSAYNIEAVEIAQIIIPTSSAIYYKIQIANLSDSDPTLRNCNFIIPNTNITSGYCYINGTQYMMHAKMTGIKSNQLRFKVFTDADVPTSIADYVLHLTITARDPLL